jgi:heme iron utilization protein
VDADTARSLRRLLDTRPVGALGTLHRGEPAVSMVPFVLPDAETRLLIHVSTLAPHTRDMLEHARVSLLVMAEPSADVSPQALPRVALHADALALPREGAAYDAARAIYLERFPDAAPASKVMVSVQPASAAMRSIKQPAKSAPPALNRRSACTTRSARSRRGSLLRNRPSNASDTWARSRP